MQKSLHGRILEQMREMRVMRLCLCGMCEMLWFERRPGRKIGEVELGEELFEVSIGAQEVRFQLHRNLHSPRQSRWMSQLQHHHHPSSSCHHQRVERKVGRSDAAWRKKRVEGKKGEELSQVSSYEAKNEASRKLT